MYKCISEHKGMEGLNVPMNITIFIGGISGGGAERVACNLANYLVDRHHVILLTMSEVHDEYGLDSRVKLVSLLKKKNGKTK